MTRSFKLLGPLGRPIRLTEHLTHNPCDIILWHILHFPVAALAQIKCVLVAYVAVFRLTSRQWCLRDLHSCICMSLACNVLRLDDSIMWNVVYFFICTYVALHRADIATHVVADIVGWWVGWSRGCIVTKRLDRSSYHLVHGLASGNATPTSETQRVGKL